MDNTLDHIVRTPQTTFQMLELPYQPTWNFTSVSDLAPNTENWNYLAADNICRYAALAAEESP